MPVTSAVDLRSDHDKPAPARQREAPAAGEELELHLVLPAESLAATPTRVADLARYAELLGYRAVWLPDHPLPPRSHDTTYGGAYEPLTVLAYIAAKTTRIRLGTSVLPLPLYNPFIVARQAVTLNQLSSGRFTLGVGAGWEPAEFESLGVDFGTRGARMDAGLRLIRHLLREGAGPFDDDHFAFSRGTFEPRPGTRLRLMIGGTSNAAMRRAADYADTLQLPSMPPEQVQERIASLRRHGGDHVEVGVRTAWTNDSSLDQVVARASAWRVAGVRHIAVWLGDPDAYPLRMAALMRALADLSTPQTPRKQAGG